MTDHELLLAISDMMDTKLKSELQPIKNDLKNLKTDTEKLKTDTEKLKTDTEKLKTDTEKLKIDIEKLKIDSESMKNSISQVKIFQENTILPRLETIESCYTDTYHRYKNNADGMESVFDDVELLKKVVTEHSKKLEKIS